MKQICEETQDVELEDGDQPTTPGVYSGSRKGCEIGNANYVPQTRRRKERIVPEGIGYCLGQYESIQRSFEAPYDASAVKRKFLHLDCRNNADNIPWCSGSSACKSQRSTPS
jgi:hypothetical protein